MPVQSQADARAKPSNTEEYPTFHWDINLEGFSAGKLPQTPVPFTFLMASTSTFPPAVIIPRVYFWINRLYTKKRVKFHFYKLAMRIQMKISILILQRETIGYLLHDPRSLFSPPVCWCPYPRFFMAVLSSSSMDLVFQTYQLPTTEGLLCITNYNCTECTTGSVT